MAGSWLPINLRPALKIGRIFIPPDDLCPCSLYGNIVVKANELPSLPQRFPGNQSA